MKNRITLDNIDKSIISLLQKDPAVSHSKIAQELGLSQPAIGARIKKLSDKGLISTIIGVNFQQLPEINLLRVNLKTTRPDDVLEMAQFCPFVINGLKTTGENNITLFLASSNLKHLDSVLDRHFRGKNYVQHLEMDLITGMAEPFILPMNIEAEKYVDQDDPCQNNPQCTHSRKIAGVRSPQELNLE